MIVRGLLGPEEAARLRDYYTMFTPAGPSPVRRRTAGIGRAQPSRGSSTRTGTHHLSRRYLLDERIAAALEALFGEEPSCSPEHGRRQAAGSPRSGPSPGPDAAPRLAGPMHSLLDRAVPRRRRAAAWRWCRDPTASASLAAATRPIRSNSTTAVGSPFPGAARPFIVTPATCSFSAA